MTRNRQLAKVLGGQHTEILIQSYSDRVLVLVTQLGKVGNLIQATIPATTPLSAPEPTGFKGLLLPTPPAAIRLTPLLGSPPSEHVRTLHSLYASQIATIVWQLESDGPLEVDRRGVVVGVALRPTGAGDQEDVTVEERETFFGVMSMIYQVFQETNS